MSQNDARRSKPWHQDEAILQRMRQVVALAGSPHWLTNRGIAGRLGISEKTVRNDLERSRELVRAPLTEEVQAQRLAAIEHYDRIAVRLWASLEPRQVLQGDQLVSIEPTPKEVAAVLAAVRAAEDSKAKVTGILSPDKLETSGTLTVVVNRGQSDDDEHDAAVAAATGEAGDGE